MMRWFIAAILIMGGIRFALTMAGIPNAIVKFASMTVIILAGAIYFAIAIADRKGRLKAAYLLILPYMIVEVAALGYGWATGRETIFHTPEYSFNTPIHIHTIGHLIGGLTWEPLLTFLFMELVRYVYTFTFSSSSRRRFRQSPPP
jgi:hypothetical protein